MKAILSKTQKSVIRLALSLMLAAGCVVSVMWAMADPAAVSREYRPVSQALARGFSLVTELLPFSIAEILIIFALVGLAVALIVFVVKLIRGGGRLRLLLSAFSHALILILCLLTLFFASWGLNYFALPIGEELGLNVQPRESDELFAVTEYLLEMSNEYAARVERDGDMVTLETELGEISVLCAEAYDAMAEKNDFFHISGGQAKSVLNWYAMSTLGITGIYIPFTAECNVNTDEIAAALPFTVAHEMAHRMGVSAENEANFVSYLVLRESGSDLLRYSAYYEAFLYCYRAAARVDGERAGELLSGLSPGVIADIRAANERYAKYEGPIQEAASKVNDTYLKVMKQESGVQSYGEVVDLIIADYMGS